MDISYCMFQIRITLEKHVETKGGTLLRFYYDSKDLEFLYEYEKQNEIHFGHIPLEEMNTIPRKDSTSSGTIDNILENLDLGINPRMK